MQRTVLKWTVVLGASSAAGVLLYSLMINLLSAVPRYCLINFGDGSGMFCF